MAFVPPAAFPLRRPRVYISRTSFARPPLHSTVPRHRPVRAALPRAALDDDNLRDVKEPVLRAVERLSRQDRVTVADVATAAGLDIATAADELVALAGLTGAAIDVSEGGDLAYRFRRDVRGALRARSVRAKLRMAWGTVFPYLFTGVRVAFGALLVLSIVVTFIAITALMSADKSDDDRRGSRNRGFGGGGSLPLRFFAPDMFDVMFYSRYRPMYYGGGKSSSFASGRQASGAGPKELSFLEAVYSFVFGDGDPNLNLEERRWRSVASVIRANLGAVTAEQLAPFLDPPLASTVGDDSTSGGESFVLPALQRFHGHPEVTDDGDIIYIFPSLSATGSRSAQSVELAGAGQSLREKELTLTSVSSGQRAMVLGLGVVNLLGVLTLGSMLGGAQAMSANSAAMLAAIRSAYPALCTYALSFVVIPLSRFLWQKRANSNIRARNTARARASATVARPPPELRRKILAASDRAQGVNIVGAEDVVYSTDQDILDQPAWQESSADDFDRRLDRRSS